MRERRRGRGGVEGEYGGVYGEEKGNADYGGMVQPSQQHVAPCVKVVERARNLDLAREICYWDISCEETSKLREK